MSAYRTSVGYFEYAVCQLLSALDRRLSLPLDDWHLGDGFGVTWEEEERGYRTVNIRPHGWPREAVIFAKFEHVREGKSPGWHAGTCEINASHIPELESGLRLMCHHRGQIPDYRFLGERPEDIKLLDNLRDPSKIGV